MRSPFGRPWRENIVVFLTALSLTCLWLIACLMGIMFWYGVDQLTGAGLNGVVLPVVLLVTCSFIGAHVTLYAAYLSDRFCRRVWRLFRVERMADRFLSNG